jgi:hypothetical protein
LRVTSAEKAIRDHLIGDSASPLEKDRARLVEAAVCDAMTPNRDEGIAAPNPQTTDSQQLSSCPRRD